MLDVSLHGPSQEEFSDTASSVLAKEQDAVSKGQILAHSRRPAILTYASPLVDTASTLTWLAFYIFGWSSESEHLAISVFEGFEFSTGVDNLPQSITVALEAFHSEHDPRALQIYECRVRIVARLGGLKWLMYNHRILSYVVFTGVFWVTSVTCFIVTYFLATWLLPGFFAGVEEGDRPGEKLEQQQLTETESESQPPIKPEESMSDTARTFPRFASGAAAPLRYDSLSVKQEEEDLAQSTILQPLEADDEDEGGGEPTESFRDSGIGTGRDETSERARSGQRRRRALFGGSGGGG